MNNNLTGLGRIKNDGSPHWSTSITQWNFSYRLSARYNYANSYHRRNKHLTGSRISSQSPPFSEFVVIYRYPLKYIDPDGKWTANGDGFWDVLPGGNDRQGARGELPGGKPYPYVPFK